MFRTRFAPSPTGPLHLGHAFSVLLAYDCARANGGEFFLRIENLDQSRCRDYFELQIYNDLNWLGVTWDGPVLRQSERIKCYETTLLQLSSQGLTFGCICSRADIRAALAAPHEGTSLSGPDGLVYPGTCRGRPYDADKSNETLRLDMQKAVAIVPQELSYYELNGEIESRQSLSTSGFCAQIGDLVLKRKGHGGVAYHVASVIDDADQKISHVIRGQDLQDITKIHVFLQQLLGLPTPVYRHHRLIRDEAGRRLAKRSDAQAISKFRAEGYTASDVRRMVGL